MSEVFRRDHGLWFSRAWRGLHDQRPTRRLLFDGGWDGGMVMMPYVVVVMLTLHRTLSPLHLCPLGLQTLSFAVMPLALLFRCQLLA